MKSHRKGDYTEAVVIAALKERGIPVSIPFGDNERYDVVVETPEQTLLRVQIKTGWLSDGLVEFKTKSQHTNSRGNVYRLYNGDVDWFLVYCHELESLYWIREDEFDSRMTLRVEAPQQADSSINWADDYAFDDRWPPDEESLDGRIDDRAAIREAVDGLAATGARVLRPVDGADARNLTVETADALYRIRVANGWITEDRVQFDTTADEVDCYVVYCEENDTLYTIDDRTDDQSISLCFESIDRERDDFYWAIDHEFEHNWPPSEPRPTPTNLTEPAVRTAIHRLEAEGHDVEFRDWEDRRRTLLVTAEQDQYRLRVENGYTTNGRLQFNARGDDRVDHYLVYYAEENALYVVADAAFEESISLRVEPPERVDETINWADDYAFAANWPPD